MTDAELMVDIFRGCIETRILPAVDSPCHQKIKEILHNMKFTHALKPVLNRGSAPEGFLSALVEWARTAPEEIFSPSYGGDNEPDIYDYLETQDGFSGRTLETRKAFMCEVLRVLGGFESSWNWKRGEDISAPRGRAPEEIEAGMFQISANSMGFDRSLSDFFLLRYQKSIAGLDTDQVSHEFQKLMKLDPEFAIEYTARLLRFTIRHNGPIKRNEIGEWLSIQSAGEFLEAILDEPTIDIPIPEPPTQQHPITLDAGHGDHDSGAVGKLDGVTYLEKEIALDVTMKLSQLLESDGRFNVKLTRKDDSFLSLLERAKVANTHGGAEGLFLSIHTNASNGAGTGFEVFTTRGETKADSFATNLFRQYEVAFPNFAARQDVQDGDPDKEANFSVLRNTRGPAALFELGFTDNVADLKILTDDAHQATMARALYYGILAYHKLPKVATIPYPPDVEPDPVEPEPEPVDPNAPREFSSLSDLKVGMVVRHKHDSKGYVVVGNHGDRVTAVREADITHPDEWLITGNHEI